MIEKTAKKDIPKVVKKRLILLEKMLLQIMQNETENLRRIKSQEIGQYFGWSSTTVRHDLWFLGYNAGVSNGYDVSELYNAVCKAISFSSKLDENAVEKCCIVGLGRIGTALLDEAIFDESNFCVVAGFDQNVNRTEILRSTFPLYPAARLETVVSAEKIKYALLCVENKNAVKIAERLMTCGISGIVNYTNVILPVRKGVMIENVSPVLALGQCKANFGD